MSIYLFVACQDKTDLVVPLERLVSRDPLDHLVLGETPANRDSRAPWVRLALGVSPASRAPRVSQERLEFAVRRVPLAKRASPASLDSRETAATRDTLGSRAPAVRSGRRVRRAIGALRVPLDFRVQLDKTALRVTLAGLVRVERLEQWAVSVSKVLLATRETLDRQVDLETQVDGLSICYNISLFCFFLFVTLKIACVYWIQFDLSATHYFFTYLHILKLLSK